MKSQFDTRLDWILVYWNWHIANFYVFDLRALYAQGSQDKPTELIEKRFSSHFFTLRFLSERSGPPLSASGCLTQKIKETNFVRCFFFGWQPELLYTM